MKRRMVALAVAVAVTAIGVFTVGALVLKAAGERALQRENALVRLEGELQWQTSLQYRASGDVRTLMADVRTSLATSEWEADRHIDEAERLGMPAARATALRGYEHAYLARVRAWLVLVAQREPAIYTAYDEEHVQPAYTRAQVATRRTADEAQQEAHDMRRTSTAGIVLLGVSVLWLFAATYRRLRTLERRRQHSRQAFDRLQRDFVASVSHDLRTPLTSILGYAEILADDADTHPAQHLAADAILRNAERLQAMCDNLLLLSAVDSGRQTFAPREVDLNRLLAGLHDDLRALTRNRRLTLHVDLPDRPILVLGEAPQLERVVSNLVSNAVKHTQDGGAVDVRLRTVGDRAVLEVQDTGMGISLADQELLFTRFFRTRTVREQEIQGTGLGLAIVASITHDHSGEVTVSSVEGTGSTFSVSLPLLAASDEALDGPSVPISAIARTVA